MTNGFLKFTTVALLGQAVISFIAAKWPEWLESTLLSEKSKYGYLIRTELVWDLVALGLVLAFLPQLVWTTRRSLMSLVRLCFHCSLLVCQVRLITATCAIAGIMFAGLSAGFLLLNISSYAKAWIYELKNHETINLNRALSVALKAEQDEGAESALPLFQTIIDQYGIGNVDPIEKKVASLTSQISMSKLLEERADDLLAEHKPWLATILYKASLKVLPTRTRSQRKLIEIQTKFAVARPNLEQYFSLCKAKDLSSIAKRAEDFEFAIRDIDSAKKVIQLNPKDDQSRVLFQLCADALRSESPDQYVRLLKEQLAL